MAQVVVTLFMVVELIPIRQLYTTTRTSTTHTHIWTFQLKGLGKDLFRVALGENFAIVDGDEMAGYAERNGGYMGCGGS